MAEIEFLLPTVQYGNVKVRATPEELGLSSVSDAYDVGVAAAVYLNVFTQGFKKGASLDVSAPEGASEPAKAETYQPGSREGAERQLDAGEKPRTVDEANEMAKLVIERELGPTTPLSEGGDEDPEDVDGDPDAPWSTTTVDAKPKPWETGATAPVKVAQIDW